jgi:hypothetical protein
LRRIKRDVKGGAPETLATIPSYSVDLSVAGKTAWVTGDTKLRAISTETGIVTSSGIKLVGTRRLAADSSAAYVAQWIPKGWSVLRAPVLGQAKALATVQVPAFDPTTEELGLGYLGVSGGVLVAALEGTHDDAGEYLASNGSVIAVALATGELTSLATGLRRPTLAVTDGTTAFWSVYESGIASSIWSASVKGGSATRTLDLPSRTVALRVDESSLYAITAERRLLRAAKTAGEVPVELAPTVAGEALAVDGAALAWAVAGPGGDSDASIMLLAK